MKKIFVIMPFGTKSGHFRHDQSDERTEVDFDDIWSNLIRKNIPDGFDVKRADELHGSLIDKEFVEWLVNSDVVLADLTFGNANVYYELGIRLSLVKFGTVLIADSRTVAPFDTRQFRTLQYNLSKIGTQQEFVVNLRERIQRAASIDSPIYSYIPKLYVDVDGKDGDNREEISRLRDEVARLKSTKAEYQSTSEERRLTDLLAKDPTNSELLLRCFGLFKVGAIKSMQALIEIGACLNRVNRLEEAQDVLSSAHEIFSDSSEIKRELGFIFRRMAMREQGEDAENLFSKSECLLKEAVEINQYDAEAIGILGGLLRRTGDYGQAEECYETAFKLEPDSLYAAIAVANIRMLNGDRERSIEQFKLVIEIANKQLETGVADHWTHLSLAEATLAVGEVENAVAHFSNAQRLQPPPGDMDSTIQQINDLIKSVENSDQYQDFLEKV